MIINLKKGIKYFEIIFEFLFILFKKNNFIFIGINIIGIFSRVMTVVAFIFSIKMASLIYEEKILTILNSPKLGILQGSISYELAILTIAIIAFLLFLTSGILPYKYAKSIANYAYDNALDFRKIHAKDFLKSFSSVDTKDKKNILRKYICIDDDMETKNFKAIIFYLFQMLQTFFVLCSCMFVILIMYPLHGFYFLVFLIVIILIYIQTNWNYTKQTKLNIHSYKLEIKNRKNKLLNHKGMKTVDNDFQLYLKHTQENEIDKKLNILANDNQTEARKIQFFLQIVLGIFFAFVVYTLSTDGNETINFTKLIIFLFILRFLFGILQNFITSLKNINNHFGKIKFLFERHQS